MLYSLLTIRGISALAIAATGAFFTDTETSSGNTFSAGSIDLLIKNESWVNGTTTIGNSWGLKNLDEGDFFFNFDDLKPGDDGEDTITLRVDNNPSWACMAISLTETAENDCSEPEREEDNSCDNPGPNDEELQNELVFMFWPDDGDNVLEESEYGQNGERVIFGPAPLSTLASQNLILADSTKNSWSDNPGDPLLGETEYNVGKAWCYGDLIPDPLEDGQGVNPAVGSGVICNGNPVTNISQTDSIEGIVSFSAVQSRNNESFTCGQVPGGLPPIGT